jgi:hypothetical protein
LNLRFVVFGVLSIATVSAGCAETRPLTLKGAERRIVELPEVRAFDARLEQLSHGEVRAIVYLEGNDPDNWDFYVGEDHPDHPVCWNRFQVNKATSAISLSLPDGNKIPLEQWRRLGAQ